MDDWWEWYDIAIEAGFSEEEAKAYADKKTCVQTSET